MWHGLNQNLHVHIKNKIDLTKYTMSACLYQPGLKIDITEYIPKVTDEYISIALPDSVTKQIEPPYVLFQIYLTDPSSNVYTHTPIKITVRKALKSGGE